MVQDGILEDQTRTQRTIRSLCIRIRVIVSSIFPLNPVAAVSFPVGVSGQNPRPLSIRETRLCVLRGRGRTSARRLEGECKGRHAFLSNIKHE